MDEQSHPPDTIEKETYLRLAADFDNYRREEKRRVADVIQFSLQKVALEIADVVDTLDIAQRHRADEDELATKAALEKILTNIGVERISVASGHAFDPMTMEAISMTDGGESQTVREEIRAGYKMQDRIIRPARVIIYQ